MKYFLYTKGIGTYTPTDPCAYAYIITDADGNIIKTFADASSCGTANRATLSAIINGVYYLPADTTQVVVINDQTYALNVLSGKWKAKCYKEIIANFRKTKRKFKIEYSFIGKYKDQYWWQVYNLAYNALSRVTTISNLQLI